MRKMVLDDIERDFYIEMSRYAGYLDRRHIERHLAITELYRRTVDLPGSVAEFGVFHGSTFFLLARLIEIFNGAQFDKYGSSSCQLFGFELFSGVALSDQDKSGQMVLNKKLALGRGGFKTSELEFQELLNNFKKITRIPDRLHLISGDIRKTFDGFRSERGGIRFKFCLVDFDLFEPTEFILQRLPNLLVPGALILFDEYGFDEWPGETAAADDFIKKHGLKLYTLPYSHAPGAYCIWDSNLPD